MTGIEVTIGNCFPEVGEILPDAEEKKYKYTANNQRANNDVMDSRCIIMVYLLFGLARDNQISFGSKSVFECG